MLITQITDTCLIKQGGRLFRMGPPVDDDQQYCKGEIHLLL